MSDLLDALGTNFDGHETTRPMLWNKTPEYGNDDYPDATLRAGFRRVPRRSQRVAEQQRSVSGATPDGRKAWEPLSDGISPAQGADRLGPTAVIKSAAKMDHARTGGTLLNQKFTPKLVEGEEGLNNLAHLVRSYFRLDGHHIQFNVVTAEALREAQAHPEKHRDLIVRVAGYSDYFCDLTTALQDEIIARTEQTAL